MISEGPAPLATRGSETGCLTEAVWISSGRFRMCLDVFTLGFRLTHSLVAGMASDPLSLLLLLSRVLGFRVLGVESFLGGGLALQSGFVAVFRLEGCGLWGLGLVLPTLRARQQLQCVFGLGA